MHVSNEDILSYTCVLALCRYMRPLSIWALQWALEREPGLLTEAADAGVVGTLDRADSERSERVASVAHI